MSPFHASAVFMTQFPQWKKMVLFLGNWILICPPLGWLIALGYRKHLILSFFHPHLTSSSIHIPSLKTGWTLGLDGLCALGVIIFYFVPTLSLIWFLGVDGENPTPLINETFVLFFGCCFILTPLTFGGTLLYYQIYIPWFSLSLGEGIVVIGLLVLTLFFIPLAFMQIASRGQWRDAFRVDRALSLFLSSKHAYVSAWKDSLYLTLGSLSVGYRIPWAIAWSYMGIVWRFNWIHAHQYPQCTLKTSLTISPAVDTHETRFCPIPMWWT